MINFKIIFCFVKTIINTFIKTIIIRIKRIIRTYIITNVIKFSYIIKILNRMIKNIFFS